MTFQSPFSRMDGRYISVTIQSPFSAFQLPFSRMDGRYISVTIQSTFSAFQLPFSRMDGRYISVTIQSTFSAFQLPFSRLSVIYLISLMRLRGNSWFRDFHSFKFVLETSMASQIVSQIYWQFTIMGMNFINKYEIARPGDNTVSAMRTYVLIHNHRRSTMHVCPNTFA